jgi:hypothetical protein
VVIAKLALLESVTVVVVVLVILILKSEPVVCDVGITQLKEPSFRVLDEITRFTTPPFSSSILTFAPGLPVYVQVSVWVEPLTHLSPPFGEATVKVPAVVIAKLALLESVMAALVVLVILIL